MNVAKNGIRVIKREERERETQRIAESLETVEHSVDAEPGAHEVEERELVSSVTGWVNDFLRRRQDGFQEDINENSALS